MRPRLVLFDIDGTLLSAGGQSARALEGALLEVFGTTGPSVGFDYSGKTDPQIVTELMRGAGIDEPAIERSRPAALRRYLERFRSSFRPEEVKAKPGVAPLLAAIAACPGVTLGLLTGNLEPSARLKLRPLDANRYFSFGAFGSDHADRYQLPPIALDRARSATGRLFSGGDTVIVGDSVHDVRCGRGVGVRAVAVATGRTSAPTLHEAGADAVLPDFSDTEATVRAILG